MAESQSLNSTLAKEPIESTARELFYIQLKDVLRASPNSELAVLSGDMNSWIGDDHLAWPERVRKFGVGRMNDNTNDFWSSAAGTLCA